MADLAAQQPVITKPGKAAQATYNCPLIGTTNHPDAAAYRVWKKDIMWADVTDGGYGRPYLAADTKAAGDIFFGISLENHLVEVADDGAMFCTVLQEGWVAYPVASFTQDDVGKVVYATDGETLTLTATDNLAVGDIKEVDAEYVWVDITEYAGKAQA